MVKFMAMIIGGALAFALAYSIIPWSVWDKIMERFY